MSKVNTTVDESKNPEGKKVVFSDRVNIRATKKARHLQPGKTYSVHPVAAEKLIAKGAAEKA